MNRRKFLLSALAIAITPIASVASEPVVLTLEKLRRVVGKMKQDNEEYYVLFMHPSQYDELIKPLSAKEEWEHVYRLARIERRLEVIA
jgi:hypothetical protein